MVDIVNPSPNRPISAEITAATIAQAAHAPGGGWVVPPDESVIEASPLDAFTPEISSSDLTVDIQSGEAFIGGVYLGRDTVSSVELAPSTNDQDVYVGADLSQPDTVIVGLGSEFASGDPRIRIARYNTDSTGIVNPTSDYRTIGQAVDVENRRYEGGLAESVAKATSASELDGQTLTDVLRNGRTVPIPLSRIQDTDDASIVEFVPASTTFKLLGVTLISESGGVPSGVSASIVDDSGTERFSTTNRSSTGTVDAPLIPISGQQAPLRLRIENDSGSTQRVGAVFGYYLE
ncbi:hypothetical protein [Halomarina rubra]|uniref:Uncharacterized protein n=1 Tax=Halomarina rubra TaxID=2071873 RepID=A0ABD6AYZ1_9EURY|nr:hypothetical protein [Halomarina rubra]